MRPSEDKISEWTDRIHAYFHTLDDGDENDEAVDVFELYLRSFAEMLQVICQGLRARDEWEFFYIGGLASARSKKMAQDFRFGAYLLNEYYMECSIPYPIHLKKMPDDFWRILLQLGEFGNFGFGENRTSAAGKSNVFKMIRAYSEIEAATDEFDDDPFMDFGFLTVSWPLSTSIGELFAAAADVLPRMHRLSYMLYRAEYIAQKARDKRSKMA
jgi:hypothetical protein